MAECVFKTFESRFETKSIRKLFYFLNIQRNKLFCYFIDKIVKQKHISFNRCVKHKHVIATYVLLLKMALNQLS